MLKKKYKSEVISILNPIEGIYTLDFKSLSGKYKYAPGQFLHIAIDGEYDGSYQWPESRCFSMQSNPSEEIIRITYAVKGFFTKKMEEELRIGSKVWLKLPYGELFTQPHNKINTVFIAGGTGLTPFLSLFTHDSFAKYVNPKVYLGFRTKDYNLYQNELDKACQLNHNLCLTIFYENIDGIIDIEKITSVNDPNSNYFVSGPPLMIKTFKEILLKKAVPLLNVFTDDWE